MAWSGPMIQPVTTSQLSYSAPPGSKRMVAPDQPSDVVSLTTKDSPAEEKSSHNWMRTAAFVGLGLVGIGMLSGCTPGVPPISDTVTTTLPAAGISVDPAHSGQLGVEVLPQGTTRIDLHRETRTEHDSDGHTRQEDVEYNSVGVYMGSGVFLDLNGNLSLIPERAFEESPRGAAAQSVSIEGPGLWNTTRVSRNGNTIVVDPAGPGSWAITHNGNNLKVDGPLWSDWNFTQQGDTTRVDFPLWGNFQVTRGENGTRVSGPAFLDYQLTRNGNELRVDGPLWNDYTITRTGDSLDVRGPAFTHITVSQHGTTTRQAGRTYGYNVTRDGNEVKVDGPGWDNWNYHVNR